MIRFRLLFNSLLFSIAKKVTKNAFAAGNGCFQLPLGGLNFTCFKNPTMAVIPAGFCLLLPDFYAHLKPRIPDRRLSAIKSQPNR